MSDEHKVHRGLRYGPLNERTVHLCVDMQRMFAEPTAWQTPWMERVLPNVLRLAQRRPSHTVFTRFIPAPKPGQGVGMWRRYYQRWHSMTVDELGADKVDLVPDLAKLVPPAKVFDKAVYSPWHASNVHELFVSASVDTVVVSGGETDQCVLATVLGAIDHGYRVVLAVDALCSSSDRTHDALLELYTTRFGQQLETASTEEIVECWR